MFYKVLTPLHYQEKKYLAGEVVELPDEFLSLDVLLQRRVIQLTNPPPEPAKLTPTPPVTPTPASPKKDEPSPTA